MGKYGTKYDVQRVTIYVTYKEGSLLYASRLWVGRPVTVSPPKEKPIIRTAERRYVGN
jgi:hypothetical protein